MTVEKILGIRADKTTRDLFDMIGKKTGESKKDIFKRLIEAEHKKIKDGQSIPDSIQTNVESIENMVKLISKDFPKTFENTSATRSAANTLYAMAIYMMKEIYRLSSSMHIIFMKAGTINASNSNAISQDSDRLAAKQFNIFLDQCLTETAVNIETMLRKD